MAGGHDQLWKDLIRTFPADFLHLAAGELAERLEMASLVLEPAEVFLDQPRGAERRMDLVGSATTHSGEELLLHVEIELRYRWEIPPRLWLYNRLLRLRRGLPVHTFVLYLQGAPAGPRVAIHREVSADREVCRFAYLSFGLSRAPAGAYLGRSEPLAWAFAARMRPEDGDRHRLRRACFERIAEARHLNDFERFLLFNCVATYLELDGGAAEEFAALLAARSGPEVAMRPITWEEKVEARGLAKGLERGLEKGLERGQEQGMREVLLRQLRKRFPALPSRAIERVEAISSPDELGSLAERLLTASSLADLGLA
ncbi:MAG TPA: DUF4351 domain-containing protein [Thermoanaerobaculia bacterium]|nr:DUF4351 domain-containing protein [Thermoanaerobaculia bacterium]